MRSGVRWCAGTVLGIAGLVGWGLSLSATAPPPPDVPGDPRRVVSLVPSLTETAYFLGAGQRLVGRSDYCDAPPEAQALPSVGGFYDPDLEAMVRLRPDLVLILEQQDWLRQRLTDLGIPSLSFDLSTVDDILRSIQELQEVLPTTAEGASRVTDLAKALEAPAPDPAEGPLVLWVHYRDPGSLQGIVGLGPGGHTDDLIRRAGGRNILGGNLRMAPTVSPEMVLRLRPDVILDDVRADLGHPDWEQRARDAWAPLLSRPELSGTRLEFVTDDLAYRPGPRIGVALAKVRELIGD